jgi:hypothetical protein
MSNLLRRFHPARVMSKLDQTRRWSAAARQTRARLEAETVAVAVAVRNRCGPRVDNFLATLRAQSLPPRCIDITVCDFGSDAEPLAELRASCARFGARLVALGVREAEWNKSWGLNAALRLAAPNAKWILATDIDMLFGPDFIEQLLRAHLAFEPAIVLCQFLDLPKEALEQPLDVVAQFEALRAQGEWVGEHATGPCLSTSRAWCDRVRGFDERMKLWGYMDQDFSDRAIRDRLRPVWIHERATLLHQWHPRKFEVHRGDPAQQALMRERYEANRRLWQEDQSIDRNAEGWGELPAGAEVIEPA